MYSCSEIFTLRNEKFHTENEHLHTELEFVLLYIFFQVLEALGIWDEMVEAGIPRGDVYSDSKDWGANCLLGTYVSQCQCYYWYYYHWYYYQWVFNIQIRLPVSNVTIGITIGIITNGYSIFKSQSIFQGINSNKFYFSYASLLFSSLLFIHRYPLTDPTWFVRLKERMKTAFLARPAQEWETIFGAMKIPGAKTRTTKEWLNSDHALASGLVRERRWAPTDGKKKQHDAEIHTKPTQFILFL